MSVPDLGPFRAAIAGAFPELAGSAFRFLAEGWDSKAIEADGRLVFKFPKHEAAERALRKEAALLAEIRPRVALPIPALRLHPGPPLFSSHEKLEGEHLLTADYLKLSDHARDRLGEDLARFYAGLHDLDNRLMAATGAEAIEPWQTPETVRRKALPTLPTALRDFAGRTVDDFEALPPDPHGETYGFFDGHGWNMAFDRAQGRLNGVYDFADSGCGPLHQDFIYSNFISPDLTGRIVTAYEGLTGRMLDRRRIATLTGFHRLSELAALADQPEHLPDMVRHVADWAKAAEAGG